MFETLLSQNVCVYVIVMCGFMGVVGRMIMGGCFRRLIKETETMGRTRKRALREIRKRYEDISLLDVEVRDTAAFVDKYIDRLKIGLISVNAWNAFIKNLGVIAAGTGIFAAVYQYHVVGDGGETVKLLMSALQFIGAAPGSTGGGVKVTTFAVLFLTIRSVAQGRDDCVIADHHIESKTVYRALTIIVIGALAAFGSAVVVYYNTSDAVSVIDAIFESCSDFGTVGLSVGVTARLKDGAKLLYMAVMFMGRVGPVSLAMSLTAKPDDNKRKIMPVGHINVG